MLPWHRRLETRVALYVSLLIGGALVAVLLAANSIVRTNALNRAAVDLQAARVAFYHLIDDRAHEKTSRLRLVTELPVFRSYLPAAAQNARERAIADQLSSDSATLAAMAKEYGNALGASFTIVTDPSGQWLTSPGWLEGEPPAAELTANLSSAVHGRARQTIVARDNRLFLFVSEPARFADEVIGTASAGFPLDDDVARELALMTRCEVGLLAGAHVSGSSLPAARRQSLIDTVRANPDAIGRLNAPAELRSLADARYVGGTYPVTAESDTAVGRLVLLQDWQPTQAFVDQIRERVLVVGGALFLLALGGGLVISRRVTRPLSEITRVTGEVAAGHWDQRVPVRGSDETAALASSFNDMTAALSHWYDEAESKTAELRDSYERFLAVAQSAADAIISIDAHGKIHFWNLSAVRTFGYVEADVLGRNIEELFDADSRELYQLRIDALRAGDTLTQGMFEAVGVRKDGTDVPIEVSLATWMAAQDANFTAMVRDITERKQAEEALRLSENELRQAQKMEAVGRLAGGVAHDFNNLLTAIRGYAELLLEDLPENDVRRDDAMQIMKAAESAGSLTRQLLAFSRKQILAPKTLNLGDIVRSMEKMLTRLIGEDVELTVRAARDVWPVRADPGQIEQVVMNLTVNARDAMPTGGTLSISVNNASKAGDPASEGDRVVITVTDTGTGMDAETLKNIFEPFFTTKEEGHGTGLGLAMVDGIVEQSGGSITVESEVGRGTTFRIYLPRVAEAAAASDRETGPVDHRRPAAETVLLVEDEPGVRRFAHQALARQGYHVIEASRGDEALLHASNHRGAIHLLLTDVVMPGMSGRVLWERLSAIRAETRVLFVSGYTDDAVVRHGIRELGLPYLQKPFSVSALSDSVRRALSTNRAAL